MGSSGDLLRKREAGAVPGRAALLEVLRNCSFCASSPAYEDEEGAAVRRGAASSNESASESGDALRAKAGLARDSERFTGCAFWLRALIDPSVGALAGSVVMPNRPSPRLKKGRAEGPPSALPISLSCMSGISRRDERPPPPSGDPLIRGLIGIVSPRSKWRDPNPANVVYDSNCLEMCTVGASFYSVLVYMDSNPKKKKMLVCSWKLEH